MDRDKMISLLPKNLVWVELGVFEGEFSKKIFELTQPKELHLVDIFPKSMVSGDKDGKNRKTIDLRNIPNELKEHFKGKNVHIHKCTTTEFLEKAIKNSIHVDAIYIDADHSYGAVSSDLKKGFQVLTKGGYICGHDYNPQKFPGVVKAVDEFCAKRNLKIEMKTDDLLPSYLIRVEKSS